MSSVFDVALLEGIHLAFGGEVFDTEARLYGLLAIIAGVLFLPRICANFSQTWAFGITVTAWPVQNLLF